MTDNQKELTKQQFEKTASDGQNRKLSEIYLAGGCFWGTQHYFDYLAGVVSTKVGYANGRTANPTYEQVKHENTGHAETVKVLYDADLLPLEDLLEQFYKIIDPTSVNRQGEDAGVQYRTGIYYTDPSQKELIENSLSSLQKHYTGKIAVEALPLSNFYTAEEYHQKYLEKNPAGYCHIPQAMFEMAKNFRKRTALLQPAP